jgi:putative ABC transport system permease protein
MWRLALKAMLGDRSKLVITLLGVGFAVGLVNLQCGMLLGFLGKTSQLIDHGEADIWIGHRHMTSVDMSAFIQERWLTRIRAVEGVERADPYLIFGAEARMPDGRFESVWVVGCDPASPLGNAWKMAAGSNARDAIRRPDGIIVDVCDAARFGDCQVGDVREINGCRARVLGMSEGIVGFTSSPYVFTSLERARNQYGAGLVPPRGCSYFLVKAKPGTDIPALVARIQERVPGLLTVRDKGSYSRMCITHWLLKTGIGLGFGMTTLLGLIVGLGVAAQTLYAAVNERRKEFATLKALGADEGCVARFLLAQALGAAGLGSLLGLAGSQVIARGISSPQAPVVLRSDVALGSVLLVTMVCLLAAWAPYWRVRSIDPASVLRGSRSTI